MIHPNMATMLGYIATDAAIPQPMLQQMVSEAANRSFNCITVDGETLKDQNVTIRNRDTAQQERVALDQVKAYLAGKLA